MRFGGSCVEYASSYIVGLGFDGATSAPPISHINADLAAWRIYGYWSTGHGHGHDPRIGALLVIAAWQGRGGESGHVGIVTSVEKLGDGHYRLLVSESNFDAANVITREAIYEYSQNNMTAIRENGLRLPVLGFVYVGEESTSGGSANSGSYQSRLAQACAATNPGSVGGLTSTWACGSAWTCYLTSGPSYTALAVQNGVCSSIVQFWNGRSWEGKPISFCVSSGQQPLACSQ